MMEIRKALASDAPQIFSIMNAVANETKDTGRFIGDSLQYIISHIENDGCIFVCESTGAIAGFIIIDIPGDKPHNLGLDIGLSGNKLTTVAHMDSIALLPKFRGLGISKALIQHGEEYLKGLGYTNFLATVHPDNAASLNSFLSLGYKIKSTVPKYGNFLRHIIYKEEFVT